MMTKPGLGFGKPGFQLPRKLRKPGFPELKPGFGTC
jgi:hypothetical protein